MVQWHNDVGDIFGAGFRNYDTLRAYDLDTKARLGDRDIVDHWIGYANGIWSDGEVVAVSETQSHRIYVYDLNSGGWRPWLGFRLDSSNHNSHGLWSDGVTLWVWIMRTTSYMPITGEGKTLGTVVQSLISH